MNALPYLHEIRIGLRWVDPELVAMLWAYYDESGEYGADGALTAMSMAGCVARLSKWCAFNHDWQEVLGAEGLAAFHMTDFERWRTPFDFKLPNGDRDHERHKRLLSALLEVMLNHVEHFAGFAESMPIPPERQRQHGSALEGCVLAAISHAAHNLWDRYQAPVTMVFGKQKHFGYGKILKYHQLFDWGDGIGRIKGVHMASPADLPQLQAADILAFEVSKAQRQGREPRYPLKVLAAGAKARGAPFTLDFNFEDRISDLLSQAGAIE